MARLLVIALAVTVAALIVFAVGFFTTQIPDTNSPVGDNGVQAVGYFDVDVRPTYYIPADSNFVQADFALGYLHIDQHMNAMPSGPVATFFQPTATAASACTSYVQMFVSGPGVSTSTKSDVFAFPQTGGQLHFFFGHTYVFERNADYLITFEVYMKGCGQYENYVFGDTAHFTIKSDGQDFP